MTSSDGLLKIAKVDHEQRLVFGWASVVADMNGSEVVDAHGDVMSPHVLEDAVYDYMLALRQDEAVGEVDLDHAERGVGRVVESMVLTAEKAEAMGIEAPQYGWWVGVKIDDDDTWERVKDGYDMLSIEGWAMIDEDEIEDAPEVPKAASVGTQGHVVNVVPEINIEQPPLTVNVSGTDSYQRVIRDDQGRIVGIETVSKSE